MLTLAISQLFSYLLKNGVGLLTEEMVLHLGYQKYSVIVLLFIMYHLYVYASFYSITSFTKSSIGKVLKAISQNEQRVEALGYKVLHYKIIASVVAGIVAAISGGLFVITLRFVNTTVFSIEMTLNALLMTMIGGVGTLMELLLDLGLLNH